MDLDFEELLEADEEADLREAEREELGKKILGFYFSSVPAPPLAASNNNMIQNSEPKL